MAKDRNQTRIEEIDAELVEITGRLQGLETQVIQLRQLNRTLIEHLALQGRISAQEFLDRLSDHHLDLLADMVTCKDCGTLISRDSKRCYSCGKPVDPDLYILG